MRSEFIEAIGRHQSAFGRSLTDAQTQSLADYFDLVQQHNPLLHLVGPCTPEEFAVRHVLESLTLLDHLPQNARFADVGAGAGLPSIPCLLARGDLTAVLIESRKRKVAYLSDALRALALTERAQVAGRQFEEVDPGTCDFVTCRALDKYLERVPRLIKWAGERKLLLFGGPSLKGALTRAGLRFRSDLIPMSEQRFLFVCDGIVK